MRLGGRQLRRSCPPRDGDRAIDLVVAERLLADPVLYSQAAHVIAMPPKPRRTSRRRNFPAVAAPGLDRGRRIAIFGCTQSVNLRDLIMAKSSTVLIKLVSSADTGFYYVTKKNPRTKTAKLELKKFDPVARKHVVFKEAKIK